MDNIKRETSIELIKSVVEKKRKGILVYNILSLTRHGFVLTRFLNGVRTETAPMNFGFEEAWEYWLTECKQVGIKPYSGYKARTKAVYDKAAAYLDYWEVRDV